MKRAYLFNFKTRGLFKQRLHLNAVFSYNSYIITAGFACPVLICIKRAKFAEAVCRKKNFIMAVISHNNLRPMHHRRGNKGKSMGAERKRISLSHNDSSV